MVQAGCWEGGLAGNWALRQEWGFSAFPWCIFRDGYILISMYVSLIACNIVFLHSNGIAQNWYFLSTPAGQERGSTSFYVSCMVHILWQYISYFKKKWQLLFFCVAQIITHTNYHRFHSFCSLFLTSPKKLRMLFWIWILKPQCTISLPPLILIFCWVWFNLFRQKMHLPNWSSSFSLEWCKQVWGATNSVAEPSMTETPPSL